MNVTRPNFCIVALMRNRGSTLPPSADIVRIRIVENPESRARVRATAASTRPGVEAAAAAATVMTRKPGTWEKPTGLGRCATLCYMGRRPGSTVGVRELRQNLSVYLDRVKKGEALTVTEHGVAVAILRPLPRHADALGRLVAEGRAAAPIRSHRNLPKPLTLSLERPLTEVLDELRSDRV